MLVTLLQAWLLVALAANAVGAAVVAWDKGQARRGGRRVPERHLVALALLGGWPLMGAAMLALRHKVSRPRFLVWFAAAAVPSGWVAWVALR